MEPSDRRLGTGDALIEALADEVVRRMANIQTQRRRLLNAEDAAEYLGISEDGLRNIVEDGRLPEVKIDRRKRFDRQDLDKLIETAKHSVRGL
jgi:excisionase family DNA binding protein